MLHDVILFFAGMLVGGMNAIAGGGMLVGFPIMLAVGIPALTANATASIVVLPGLVGSAFGYKKYLRRVPRIYLLLLVPAIIGSAVGASILSRTSSSDFEELVPWLILGAGILFAFQPALYNQLQQHLHGSKRQRSNQQLLIVGLAVIPLSVYGGFFGVGFGLIMLAFLGFTRLHDHIHRMNALKNIITTCISGTTAFVLLGSGLIDWRHGVVMGVGCSLGGYGGARFAQRLPGHVIRVIIIIIGLGAAIYLGLRNYTA